MNLGWGQPWNSRALLNAAGILGMNRRNAEFILPLNRRSLFPCVDDKLVTKAICVEHHIPVPETYGFVERYGDVQRLAAMIDGRQEFVIKPSRGCGGRGVIVVTSRNGEDFSIAGRPDMGLWELQYHVSGVLAGLYSLGGRLDKAIIEERITRHPQLEPLCAEGTPDVRIIVYRGVPVMAMIRLPTRLSRGRANLHQGAVGAGIDIHTGCTTGGVWKDRMVADHPDTGTSLKDFPIPSWRSLLRLSVDVADALRMGYLGVDLVVDRSRGPVVLEANARPGLAIQIANRTGLLPRLRFVEQHAAQAPDAEQRIELVPALSVVSQVGR